TLAPLPVLPASVNSLTLSFPSAPIVLPSLTLTTLNVTAPGIRQQPGSALTITGLASFQADNAEIVLTGANDFAVIRVISSGPNDITINDINELDFANSVLGSGPFKVTAGGRIRENGNQIIQLPIAVEACL